MYSKDVKLFSEMTEAEKLAQRQNAARLASLIAARKHQFGAKDADQWAKDADVAARKVGLK